MTLASVNRATLREQVLGSLRSAILDGTIPAGQKLGEVDLADQFGVSRGTVREALRTLHNSGLLEGSERNSLYVRRVSAAEVVELYEVRAALEGQAVATILRSARADTLIDDLEGQLPEGGPGMSYAQRFELDLRFHEALCRLSGNQTLHRLWVGIKDLMRLSVLAVADESSDALMNKSHHMPIIEALRAGDPENARNVLAEHMATAADIWSAKAASTTAGQAGDLPPGHAHTAVSTTSSAPSPARTRTRSTG